MKKLFTFFVFCLSVLPTSAQQCAANFTYTVNAAGNVVFSNTSTFSGTTQVYYWDFGDYQMSNQVNPSHTYAGNGVYVVTLNLYDSIPSSSCFSTISQTITISNTACLLTAYTTTYLSSGGTVYFNDQSSGTIPLTSYTLDYGDNSSSNSIVAHTYTSAGLYTVTLTEENLPPSCVSIYTTVINVSIMNCSLTANFNYSLNAGIVTFTNTTVGASASAFYQWNFGNSNSSNLQNPGPENYLYNGTYTVTLSVSDSVNFWCSSTITKTIAITNASCYANSSFFLQKDSTQMPTIVWNAYPNFSTNVVSAIWIWGDNTSSNALYPTHTYSAAGIYNVCLTVSVSCGNTSTTCVNSNIFRGSESLAMAVIHVIDPTAGVKKNALQESASVVFPNPNGGTFFFKNEGEFEKATILDQTGNVLMKRDDILNNKEIKIETDLQSGMYFIRLDSKNTSLTKKIVINR